jgi:hypothetical protein
VQTRSHPPWRTDLLVIAAYVLLVVAMWAWYGVHSGMGYETAFAVESELDSERKPLYYHADGLRRFTSFFYHIAYLAGRWSGFEGSFVPYQLVYALLWLFRGLLVFQIVRMLAPGASAVAFLAGAFTIVHAADGALNWVGQLNQFGFIFWMLLSFYLLLSAFACEQRNWLAPVLAIMAAQSARLSIFSYESPLPLILAFPVLCLALLGRWSWRNAALMGIYWWMPLQYSWRYLRRYLDRTVDETYQFSVVRQDWQALQLVLDWAYNAGYSLAFWRWPRNVAEPADAHFALVALTFAGLGAAVAAGAYLLLCGVSNDTSDAARRYAWRLSILGIAMVALSFPAYLLLDSATTHWRTQLLSGPGAGIALAGAISLAHERGLHGWRIGVGASAAIAAAIAASGIWTGQQLALHHRALWERHRAIVAGVLHEAPQVENNTLLVLVNRTGAPLVFGHNMWWDLATRLAYPKRAVAGIYFDAPGRLATGVTVRFSGTRAEIQSDFKLNVEEVSVRNLVVLDILSSGVTMARELPAWLGVDAQYVRDYQPARVIGGPPPDPRAVRRYCPC